MEKEEQICLLTQQNTELLEKTIKQSQDLREKVTSQSQELTRTKQELTQKVTSQSQELTRTNQELTQTKHELMQIGTSQSLQLTRSKQELMQELTRTKQELAQKVASQSQELSRVKQELTQKATSQDQELELVKLKEAQRQAIDQLQTQQQCDLQKLRTEFETQRDIFPATIKMAGFDELKKKGTTWYSRPFYTSMAGYKMCLIVDANGEGDGEGTHISVGTCLMRGEFDSHLKWPFRGTVTVQLVNQLEDREHHTGSFDYNDACFLYVAQVYGERSYGLGSPKFLPHSELGLSVFNNCQYLKDNCLIFRIVSVKLN